MFAEATKSEGGRDCSNSSFIGLFNCCVWATLVNTKRERRQGRRASEGKVDMRACQHQVNGLFICSTQSTVWSFSCEMTRFFIQRDKQERRPPVLLSLCNAQCFLSLITDGRLKLALVSFDVFNKLTSNTWVVVWEAESPRSSGQSRPGSRLKSMSSYRFLGYSYTQFIYEMMKLVRAATVNPFIV